MFNRRLWTIFFAVTALVTAGALCSDIEREMEAGERAEQDRIDQTNAALNATLGFQKTGTAVALLTPSSTPVPTATATPHPPTPTPSPEPTLLVFSLINLPPPIQTFSDPAGDAVLCADGSVVDDPAVDIVSLNIYDPAAIGFDLDGWLLQVGLGAPANGTFAEDWSAALLSAVAIEGSDTYILTLNEIHDGFVTIGVIDPANGQIQPDTDMHSFIDENGFVWFLMPSDAAFLQVSSFHLPLAGMPQEDKRCDLAPDERVYTLELPEFDG